MWLWLKMPKKFFLIHGHLARLNFVLYICDILGLYNLFLWNVSWIQIRLSLWSLPSFNCSLNVLYCDGGVVCSYKCCGSSQHNLIKFSSLNWIFGQPLNSTMGNANWLKFMSWFPLCMEIIWSFCSCIWTNQNLVSWINLNGYWFIVKICLLWYFL